MRPRREQRDERRLLPCLRQAWLEDDQAAALARVIVETGAGLEEVRPDPYALPGEPERLRGIPLAMRGVRGAMRGTRPEDALHELEKQQQRWQLE